MSEIIIKPNLLGFDYEGLVAFCAEMGEKSFRAKQLYQWIHQRGVADFDLMTDLAKSLRAKLKQTAEVRALPVLTEKISRDGTIKWLFDVGQGNAVEAVYIPEVDRATLCVSSQAGCAIGCRFCSTGHQGFSRNLTSAEIQAQLWYCEHELRRRFQRTDRIVSNVVMMGMGEPLQNYRALVPVLRTMIDDNAYGLSRRRVTVSTSGVVSMMSKLAQSCPVALAVSLHAPNDSLRDQLVPLNRKYPLQELIEACRNYLQYAPRDFITFEYCMLSQLNDRPEHAHQLLELLSGNGRGTDWFKLNLIPFNPFDQSGLLGSSSADVQTFARILLNAGVVTTVRKTRGDDIAAACGQLAGEVKDRTRAVVRLQRNREVASELAALVES